MRFSAIAFCVALLAAMGLCASAQDAPAPSYEVIARGPVMELRFHGLPLKSVHADESQNEIALDFRGPIDGAVFDRLAGDLPDWVATAFAGDDSAVIRTRQPVTFMTRPEADGFSLRLVPHNLPADAPPVNAPSPIRNGDGAARLDPGPAPAPQASVPDFHAALHYYTEQLALLRGDETLQTAYQRGHETSETWIGGSGDWHQFHNGDTVIHGDAAFALGLTDNVALTGTFDETLARANSVRLLDGTFAALHRDVMSGKGGLAFAMEDGTLFSADVTYGNHLLGGHLGAFLDAPDGFWNAAMDYRTPYLATPEAIADRATRDMAGIGFAQQIDGGFWGAGAIAARRYGVAGDSDVASTLGWSGNLRYTFEIGDVLAGLSYDGVGEYVMDAHHYAPGFIPLGIRTLEVHSATGSASFSLLDGFWFDLYGGYAVDRYAGNGALYGGELRYTPVSGFDLALGARHAQVSTTQGETGPETSAGLSLTLGLGDAPQSYLQQQPLIQ